MADFIFTNNSNSFSLDFNGTEEDYPRNQLSLRVNASNSQVLEIRDTLQNGYLLASIDLNEDFVDVDGNTSFPSALSLKAALEPLFFLVNSGGGSTDWGDIGGNIEDQTDLQDTFLNKVTTDPQTVAGEVEFLSDITVPSGSVILGKDGARVSSAARSLAFTDARERKDLVVHYEFDESGSLPPYYWDFSPLQNFVICPDSGTSIPSPQEFFFPGTAANTMSRSFVIKPLSSGTLNVKSWEGVDDTGALLIDNDFEILPSDIGTDLTLVIPAPVISEIGDSQFTRFSGIDLDGAVQSTGNYVGQLKPYLESNFNILSRVDIGSTQPPNVVELGDWTWSGVGTGFATAPGTFRMDDDDSNLVTQIRINNDNLAAEDKEDFLQGLTVGDSISFESTTSSDNAVFEILEAPTTPSVGETLLEVIFESGDIFTFNSNYTVAIASASGIVIGDGIVSALDKDDIVVLLDTSTDNIERVLPQAFRYTNRSVTFKKVSNGGNYASIAPYPGEFIDDIDDSHALILGQKNDSCSIYSDGTQWRIIQRDTSNIAVINCNGGGSQVLTSGVEDVIDCFDFNAVSTPGVIEADASNNKISILNKESAVTSYHIHFKIIGSNSVVNREIDVNLYVGGVLQEQLSSWYFFRADKNYTILGDTYITYAGVVPADIEVKIVADGNCTITYDKIVLGVDINGD